MKKNIPYILIIFFFSVLFFIWLPHLYIGDDCLFHTTNIIANASTSSLLPQKILPLIEDNIGYLNDDEYAYSSGSKIVVRPFKSSSVVSPLIFN